MTPVPNQIPTLPFNGIAFVGEAPGKDEEALNRPFIGASGRLLDQLLSKAGIVRAASYIGNVCQVRPPGNVIAEFDWDGPEIQAGIGQLKTDLEKLRPNLVVCLGATAMHLFKEGNVPLRKRKVQEGLKFVYPNSVDDWRGSRFLSVADGMLEGAPIQGVKCLATHHPAFVLRAFENMPLLMMDLMRAAREGKSPDLILPQRELKTNLSYDETLYRINYIRSHMLECSLDIEGNWQHLPCISIAVSGYDSFILAFCRRDGSHIWTEDQELVLIRALSGLLADPNVPKVWQNGLYDRWSLQYGHHFVVNGNADDTMPMWWEKYCELKKGLGTQASILTDEPFYKGDIASQDDETFFRYCCRDSAITKEIKDKLAVLLPQHHHAAPIHYRLNHDLLNVFLYMEMRGMLYDKDKAKQKLHEIETYIYRLQADLDTLAGVAPLPESPEEREKLVRNTCCYKRDLGRVKAEYAADFDNLIKCASGVSLDLAATGYLNTTLGRSCNIKSKDYKDLLYRKLGLPPQYQKGTDKETTDGLALQKLAKRHPHPAVTLGLEIALLRTRAQMLQIACDPDGRIRSSYNGVGTKTGRVTSSTSPTGSGYNLQTLPDDDNSKSPDHPLREGMRRLVLADPGHDLAQCDLKGSDGWTIGSWLSYLGDSTMLDDLKFSLTGRGDIKPAMRIAYMLRHGNHSLRGKTRDEIAQLLREIKKTDWDYFACKVGIWGVCYLMGPDLLADQIFEESEGKVTLSRTEVNDFRKAVFDGYGIKRWHDFAGKKLKEKPILTSASGHTRRFYGRPEEALGEYLAHEPQSNTTYATNMAAYRLWTDPENRLDREVFSRGGMLTVPFRIEPLHQVHDALIMQFRHEDREWAIPKIRSYFNNPLIIAGQRIVIPFEGNFGPSWGDQKSGKI